MGAGGVGMNAVQGASLSGASHVVVVDPAPSKKTWAPRFGATEVYDNFAEADAFIKSITVAMFQKRIQGSLYGMGSPRDAMPNLLNLYAAGRLKLDELITRRYALDDVNQAYADMRSGVNIRGVVDFIPAG